MGFRFQRRIKLGGGAGLNISKSGVSASVRSRSGTIGTKGFSIRTGIPGLTYRSAYGRKSSDARLIALLLFAVLAVLPFLIQVLVVAAQITWRAISWIVRALIVAPVRIIYVRLRAWRASRKTLPPPPSKAITDGQSQPNPRGHRRTVRRTKSTGSASSASHHCTIE
jgi:hypothetical protein